MVPSRCLGKQLLGLELSALIFVLLQGTGEVVLIIWCSVMSRGSRIPTIVTNVHVCFLECLDSMDYAGMKVRHELPCLRRMWSNG